MLKEQKHKIQSAKVQHFKTLKEALEHIKEQSNGKVSLNRKDASVVLNIDPSTLHRAVVNGVIENDTKVINGHKQVRYSLKQLSIYAYKRGIKL